VSHAHNISRRVWNPNLQRVRAVVEGRTQQMTVCTRCIKANKVQKKPRKSKVA
jgi:large subunit ribosomal protein L28